MNEGTMQVIAKEGWIYLRADFNNLTSDESNFMRECYWACAPWCDFDKEGDAPLYKANFATDNVKAMKSIFKYADVRGIEIADDVYDVVAEFSKEANQERAKKEEERKAAQHIKDLQEIVKRAYTFLRGGCYDCHHLQYEFGEHKCLYANRRCRKSKEEEEYEFYAKREERITGVEPAYFALPYPCAGCEYIVNAQKAQEELEKLTIKQ